MTQEAEIPFMTRGNGIQALVGILLLSGTLQVLAGDKIVEWKISSAGSPADGGISLIDSSGNGLDLQIPTGAVLIDDPDVPGAKALVANGTIQEPPMLPSLPSMTGVQLVTRIKPNAGTYFQSEILGTFRWSLRYSASRKSVILVVYAQGEGANRPRVELEAEAKPYLWNTVTMEITETKISLKTDSSQSAFLFGSSGVKYAPFDAMELKLFRPMKGAYEGSLGDVQLAVP